MIKITAKKQSMMNTLLKDNNQQVPLSGAGNLVKGKVINISSNKILLDLGPIGVGIVMGPEFKESFNILGKSKIGDEISAQVLIPENEDGYIELSVKNAILKELWQELENKFTKNESLLAEVTEANKGGLIIRFRGIIGFLPVSQLASEHYPRVEGGDKGKIVQELKKLINTTLEVKILNLDRKEKKVIFSEKNNSAKPNNITGKYKKDDIAEGVVTGIVDFGIFVKLEEGIEGLVHISELAWQLIESPNDIVKVGDKVKVKIIDLADGKISLSMKVLQKDPWENIEKKYEKGVIVEGAVTKFNPFGAFIALDKNIHGLCHISEFSTQQRMESELEIGKKYKFKIISIEPDDHRMALGLINEETEKKKEEEKEERGEKKTE